MCFNKFYKKSVLKGQSKRRMLEEKTNAWMGWKKIEIHFIWAIVLNQIKTNLSRSEVTEGLWRRKKKEAQESVFQMWYNSTTVNDFISSPFQKDYVLPFQNLLVQAFSSRGHLPLFLNRQMVVRTQMSVCGYIDGHVIRGPSCASNWSVSSLGLCSF